MFPYSCVVLFVGSSLIGLTGCQRGAVKVAPPEIPVIPVSHPIQRKVSDYVDYTGRTNAKNSVTIQPRVTGYLVELENPFKEGSDVAQGDVLFKIDPRPYEAQLKAAHAQVAQNIASRDYAVATNARFKEIDKKLRGAVSQRELDQYQAQEEQALANLNIARANLLSAELNLEWTVVKSPVDGRISRYFLTPGNLVNQDVTQLTTVISLDPMYVYFDMDEPTLLRIKKAMNEGKITPPRRGTEPPEIIAASIFGLMASPMGQSYRKVSSAILPGRIGEDLQVEMALQGEDSFPHKGIINFFDNQVNPNTGSILVRGKFSNPRPSGGNYLLVPGMFVRVRLSIGQPQDELLVIDRAITSNQGLKSVFVIDADNKVKERRISLGSLQEDGLRVVTQGLKKDDWVIIGGLQQVRPEMKIQVDKVTMPSLGTVVEKVKEMKK